MQLTTLAGGLVSVHVVARLQSHVQPSGEQSTETPSTSRQSTQPQPEALHEVTVPLVCLHVCAGHAAVHVDGQAVGTLLTSKQRLQPQPVVHEMPDVPAESWRSHTVGGPATTQVPDWQVPLPPAAVHVPPEVGTQLAPVVGSGT
jgi:hypothetical protein